MDLLHLTVNVQRKHAAQQAYVLAKVSKIQTKLFLESVSFYS